MRWMLSLIGALLVAGATVSGIRHVLQPPLALFVVPGATDIQVVALGPGTHLITYQAPGRRCAWYATVTQTLAAHHWQAWSAVEDHTSEPEPAPEMRAYPPRRTYTHMVTFPLGYLWDQVVLDPDPNVAWSKARAPVHCHRAQADLVPGHPSDPDVARIVVRRTILPSYWLVDRKQKLFEWLQWWGSSR